MSTLCYITVSEASVLHILYDAGLVLVTYCTKIACSYTKDGDVFLPGRLMHTGTLVAVEPRVTDLLSWRSVCPFAPRMKTKCTFSCNRMFRQSYENRKTEEETRHHSSLLCVSVCKCVLSVEAAPPAFGLWLGSPVSVVVMYWFADSCTTTVWLLFLGFLSTSDSYACMHIIHTQQGRVIWSWSDASF